ncbi:hypothetical protein ABT160_43580 [Streptomyces sp. NPDC001941]|uniref:hypothetical protein n=1 Tax=Streptomyces sp. NPDC001941 TaxID=3154659 RepID=UPI00332322A9
MTPIPDPRAAAFADLETTDRLLSGLDDLVALVETRRERPAAELHRFIEVVHEGLMTDQCGCHRYPPTGHTYPTPQRGDAR